MVACWIDSSRETLGRRRTWIAMAPSSSRGMNSAPRKGTASNAATTAAPPRRGPAAGGAETTSRTGAYPRLIHRMSKDFALADPPSQEERREHGRDGEGQEERADQRQHHRHGHRAEQLPLDALKRQDREVDDDDDADAEDDRPADLGARLDDGVSRRSPLWSARPGGAGCSPP